jgi:phospholipid-translocating ATPase
MSSIPLRPIRKLGSRRNGYAPLNDPNTDENQYSQANMSSTGTLSNKAKGKKRVRYNDEVDVADESENIGLLEGEGELEGDLDDGWKQVRLCSFESTFHSVLLLSSQVERHLPSRLHVRNPRNRKIIHELSLSDHQVCFKITRSISRLTAYSLPETLRNSFPPNRSSNTKYTIITFLPIVLFNQFKFFFNLYFLLVALSQFFPPLKIGFLTTYVAPLAFVLVVTMGKEALDDIKRSQRDKEVNSTRYEIILPGEGGERRSVPSSSLKVGDLVVLEKDQRVPADCVLLRTGEESGTCFIR